MSGLPTADLAAEQQQPGDPGGLSQSHAPSGTFTAQGSDHEGLLGSELPEAPRDKFFRKMKEQPLVPIGESLRQPSIASARLLAH